MMFQFSSGILLFSKEVHHASYFIAIYIFISCGFCNFQFETLPRFRLMLFLPHSVEFKEIREHELLSSTIFKWQFLRDLNLSLENGHKHIHWRRGDVANFHIFVKNRKILTCFRIMKLLRMSEWKLVNYKPGKFHQTKTNCYVFRWVFSNTTHVFLPTWSNLLKTWSCL